MENATSGLVAHVESMVRDFGLARMQALSESRRKERQYKLSAATSTKGVSALLDQQQQVTIPMETVFKDYTVVRNHFVHKLGTDPTAMDSLRSSSLDVPQIILQGGNNPDTIDRVVCSPAKLGQYLTLPANSEFTMVNMSMSLCGGLDEAQSLELKAIVLEELNVEPIVDNARNVTWERVLANANLSQTEVEAALRAFRDGVDVLANNYADELEALAEAFNGTELSKNAAEASGQVMCGEKDALTIDLWWVDDLEGGGGGGGDGGGGDGGDGDGGGDGGNNGTEVDACTRLQNRMYNTEGGRYGWDAISPFLQGKLLYTPMNDYVDGIVQIVSYSISTSIYAYLYHPVLQANDSYARLEPYLSRLAKYAKLGESGLAISKMDEDFEILDVRIIIIP